MSGGIIALIVVLVLAVIILFRSLKIIHQYERGIVERLGRYRETLEPGLKFLVPFIDTLGVRVDMRETVLDIEPQPVITKDNVTVTVDAVTYYYVADAKARTYEVANFGMAVSKLAQTNIRNVIGEMSLDETLTSRERINAALRETLDEATDKWGVKITRVEVKEIEPPRDIADAMSKQMKAEREKRATILEAEAYRAKQILEAEGKAIEEVSNAADKFFIGNAQMLKQLQVTQAALEKNTKLVVSDQSRLVNVLGLGEALSNSKGSK